jgi:ferredoxin
MLEEEALVRWNGAGQLVVDRAARIGSGNCAFWAPGIFDLDDEDVAVVRGDPTGREEEVRRAVLNCPTKAISMRGAARR